MERMASKSFPPSLEVAEIRQAIACTVACIFLRISERTWHSSLPSNCRLSQRSEVFRSFVRARKGESKSDYGCVCPLVRTDLMATVLAITLYMSTKQEIRFDLTDTVFWTDSMIVLGSILFATYKTVQNLRYLLTLSKEIWLRQTKQT